MTRYLLDANVLIALTVREHVDHKIVADWISAQDAFAVCPIVEGGLVRFLIRAGERASVAQSVVATIRANPKVAFWPDDLSYVDVALDHVIGHRQVTDAYLLSLVLHNGDAKLATLDQGLVASAPDLTTHVE